MHIYNITFGVDPAVEAEFLDWLRGEFIEVSTADGEYFSCPELMRVHADSADGSSYALHMRAAELDDINKWYADHGARLFDKIQRTWAGRVVFFPTTLTLV